MDYEKKYKESVEKLRYKITDNNGNIDYKAIVIVDELQDIFPELCESEDERIIDDAIQIIRASRLRCAEYGTEANKHLKAIAYLEKQKAKEDLDRMAPIYEDKESFESALEKAWKFYNDSGARTVDSCEDNYVECAHAKGFREGFLSGLKQKEHKPADKVEPKFHIEKGQWYVCIQSFTLNLNTIVVKGRTYKSREDNVISGEDARLFIDKHDGDASKYFRTWTIQDAKNGDVLVDVYGNIGIYEKHDNFNWLSYFSLGFHGGFQNFKVEHENDKTHPATKEQRDLLFSKIKEAGYEWDVEKKELKKIEQKPVECEKHPESKSFEDEWKDYYNNTKSFEDEWKDYYNNSLINRQPMPNKREIARHFFWFGQKQAEKPAEWSEVVLEFRGEKVKVKRPFHRDDKGRGYSTTEQDEDVAWNALRAWCEKKGISLYDLYPKAELDEEYVKGYKQYVKGYEDGKKEAEQRGYERGYQKGYEDGRYAAMWEHLAPPPTIPPYTPTYPAPYPGYPVYQPITTPVEPYYGYRVTCTTTTSDNVQTNNEEHHEEEK